jgi:putative ABC transport system ATP-binding protein
MLSIRGLTQSLPFRANNILNNINLELKEGELCIIIGNNRSGKSMLLKTIMGEYKTDSGEIYLDGKEISKFPVYQRANMISIVGQDIADDVMGEMTLLENLVISYLRGKTPSFGLYGNYSSQIRNIVSELGFGLEKYLHSPIAALSLDQRQIIAILMAVMSDTKLLLFDECLSFMDPKVKSSLMGYITKKIEFSKITTLMVTNNFADALEYGDRVIILHNGRIVSDIQGNEKLSLTKDHLTRLLSSVEVEGRY